jgi:diaminopimelate decarboxylase
VIYAKDGEAKKFLILDAGMNDHIRPAMYDAHHDIVSVREPAPNAPRARYDVVGPVCESSDRFAADMDLPALNSGDLVAILTAGAYGAVMSSAYNARPPAPEVLVKAERWSIVRPRQDYDALIGTDRIPDWLDQAR